MSAPIRDFREILRREYSFRAGRNPAYSLRAFAKFLGISSSRLSEILSGKQGLSVRWATRIADSLGLTELERQVFCDLVEIHHGKSSEKKRYAEARLAQAQEYQVLQLDAFQVISDWYHFAITELALTDGFRSEPAWIAKRLGLSPKVIEMAIERLLRLGLLKRSHQGKLTSDPEVVMTPDGVPSEAIKKFHSQVLERAARAIYTQPVSERDFSTVLFPFDSSRISDAKATIREFRRGFTKRLYPMKAKDSVYCLAVQFYRVDEDPTNNPVSERNKR